MKNLIFLLLAGLLLLASPPAKAQLGLSPTVVLNCDSTLTITSPIRMAADGSYPAAVKIDINYGAQTPALPSIIMNTPPQGQLIVVTTPGSISPSTSHCSVTVSPVLSVTNPIGVNSAYTSTSVAWFLNSIPVPALLGYEYHNGTAAVQKFTCPVQSAATFITKKKGKGNNNGNGPK